jgi:sn-glycerol 3-phosphate transport system permease protein
MWENYREALLGSGKLGSNTNVVQMMWVSFVVAMVITVGKIAISLLSAFAIVYFRFPFKMVCFWAIFLTLMLPVEVRILPTYKVVAAGPAQQLRRPDPAADRLGHRHLPVPPVLPDRAGRAGGSRPHRRRRRHALFQGHPGALVQDLDCRAVRDPVHLRLEPVPVAAADDHLGRHVPRGDRHQAHAGGGGEAAVDWNIVMATAILAMLPPTGGDADAKVVRQGPGGYREISHASTTF